MPLFTIQVTLLNFSAFFKGQKDKKTQAVKSETPFCALKLDPLPIGKGIFSSHSEGDDPNSARLSWSHGPSRKNTRVKTKILGEFSLQYPKAPAQIF
jgi:hypothetical protein